MGSGCGRVTEVVVGVKGGGDIGSGVAWRLFQCGFKVFVTEIPEPLAVRRRVSFCEAVYEGRSLVEGVEALLVRDRTGVLSCWETGRVPILVDPDCEIRQALHPEVLVDATLAKANLGTSQTDAPLVLALGPGFLPGKDVHGVIETQRGHALGRLLTDGPAAPNTGIPGPVLGFAEERVLRAPASGPFRNILEIGDAVRQGERVGSVGDTPVLAGIPGVIRGLIRPGIRVETGLKIGDIDPRGTRHFCFTISEKALAIAGGVIEGILRFLHAGPWWA